MGEQGFTCLGTTVIDVTFVLSLHIKCWKCYVLKACDITPIL